MNPYGSMSDIDAKTGEYVIRLTKDVVQPPIDEWSPIIGDAAHNLMSALDHLVCQLSTINGRNAECDGTMFPIWDRDTPEIQSQITRRIKSLYKDDQRIIRDLQPYSRGSLDLAQADPLWLLFRMDVIDKHRRMHLVSSALYDPVPFVAPRYTITDLVRSEGTKAGDEILRFRATQ